MVELLTVFALGRVSGCWNSEGDIDTHAHDYSYSLPLSEEKRIRVADPAFLADSQERLLYRCCNLTLFYVHMTRTRAEVHG